MAILIQQRAPAIDAFLCDGKEEVFWVHVLVDEMHSALLVCQAFALTTLDKAGILDPVGVKDWNGNGG
jgi:hypothetical protein